MYVHVNLWFFISESGQSGSVNEAQPTAGAALPMAIPGEVPASRIRSRAIFSSQVHICFSS